MKDVFWFGNKCNVLGRRGRGRVLGQRPELPRCRNRLFFWTSFRSFNFIPSCLQIIYPWMCRSLWRVEIQNKEKQTK